MTGGWRQAVDYALERPDLVVVTSSGDRFSAAGWVVHTGSDRATAVATDQARREADAAASASESADAETGRARAAADAARAAVVEATRNADRAVDHRRALADARSRIGSELEALVEESTEAVRHNTALADRIERDTIRLGELDGRLPDLERAGRRRRHPAAFSRRDPAPAPGTPGPDRRSAT